MDENLEFGKVEKMLFERAAETRTPIYGGFELTPYCNLACKMCFISEREPGLPVLDAAQWLDFGHQAAEMGTLVIQLTGGEPMLHPQFREIYSGLKRMGLVLTMNTNATLIDEQMADFLAADMPRRVNISIYGDSREAYEQLCGRDDAFDKVIHAIELMQERKIPVKVNLAPNTISFPHLDGILEICRLYQLPAEMTTYMFEPVRRRCPNRQSYRLASEDMATAVEKWDRYRYNQHEMVGRAILATQGLKHFDKLQEFNALMPLRCRAATSSFWLGWDGKMTACVNMTKPRANVCELGFAKAWEEVKCFGETIQVSARCAVCPLRFLCLSCAAISLHEYGRFDRTPQIMCEATKTYALRLSKTVRRVERRRKEDIPYENQEES